MSLKRHAIAEKIRNLILEYDFYEYKDNYETAEDAHNEIFFTLIHYPGFIVSTLEDIIADTDNREDAKTAKELIADIRETFYL